VNRADRHLRPDGSAFAGLTVNGNITASSGDIYAYRSGGTTGVIYLNSAGTRYLYFDGTNYNMPSSNLLVNGNTVLTAGNYNSYAPTLTGTGASGSWGINVTGSAGSASVLSSMNISQFTNNYGYNRFYDGWVANPGYDANTIGASKSGFSYGNNCPNVGPLVHFEDGGYGLQLNATYSGGTNLSYRTRNGDAGSWNSWYTIIHSGNIGSQSVNYATSAGSASNASTVTNGVYTTSSARWPLNTWMFAIGAGSRNWYIGGADMYWELGGYGSFHFRNTSDADVATISNAGAITAAGLTSSAEIIGTMGSGSGQFRMINGNYGAFWRNDGSSTYLLLTNSGDQYGSWNGLRPLYISDSSGYVNMGNGLGVSGGLTADSLNVSGVVTATNTGNQIYAVYAP